ncbi:MAG: hypothetical protein ABSH20_27925, partial [Tepidisphaeraceae bacterium]
MPFPRIILAALAILSISIPVFSAETPAERAAHEARELLDRNAKAHPPASVIRIRPSQRIKATLVFATGGPKLNVEKWILFA